MWQPTKVQIAAALAHAEQCKPLECCGLIADGEYVPVANLATVHDTFRMDMRAYKDIAQTRRLDAVVHSHIYHPAMATDADRASCESTGLPWLIVSWPTGLHAVIEPCGYRAPLVGRQWAWGTHDCYGLIRDGFLDYTGIRLRDFDREWLWWKEGGDIIAEHFAEAGFVPLPDETPPQHCDVMGMRLASKVVNHLGLFLHPDVILHQVMGRTSVREVYGGTWRQATQLHLRHKRFMESPPLC